MRTGTAQRVFTDRAAAGAALARALGEQTPDAPVLVLGLPRGGVAVAREVATALHAPLDVLVVRKITLAHDPEFAIGAAASGGIVLWDAHSGAHAGEALEAARAAAVREIERRERLYRPGRAPLDLRGKEVILVDDGLATGATMLAAIRAARQAGAARIIAAVPVGSPQAAERVRAAADLLVILSTPAALFAVGEWYERFEQLEDAEVCRLLGLEGPKGTPR